MTEVMLKQWGNSIGVILPIEELRKLNLCEGDKVEVNIVKKVKTTGFGMFKGAKPFEEEKEEHEEFW